MDIINDWILTIADKVREVRSRPIGDITLTAEVAQATAHALQGIAEGLEHYRGFGIEVEAGRTIQGVILTIRVHGLPQLELRPNLQLLRAQGGHLTRRSQGNVVVLELFCPLHTS